MAEHTEAEGVTIGFQRPVEVLTGFADLVAPAVDVVDGQKDQLGCATTSAMSAVVFDDLGFQATPAHPQIGSVVETSPAVDRHLGSVLRLPFWRQVAPPGALAIPTSRAVFKTRKRRNFATPRAKAIGLSSLVQRLVTHIRPLYDA